MVSEYIKTNGYRRRYPEKHHAHERLQTALRGGKLKKPKNCERCGKNCNPHGHHEDYKAPLIVIWVCPQCHKDIHHPIKKHVYKTPKTRLQPYKPHHKQYHPAPKRDALLDKAKDLRFSGISYRKIAFELGVTSGTIFKWLNERPYS